MFQLLMFIAFYCFVAGIYYGVTKDEEAAFLWVLFMPLYLGQWVVKIFKSDGKKDSNKKGN